MTGWLQGLGRYGLARLIRLGRGNLFLLRLLGSLCPQLSDRQLLAIATTHGAQALGRPGLGTLRRGGRADLLAVPASSDDEAALLGAFVRGELTPSLVLSAGRRIR